MRLVYCIPSLDTAGGTERVLTNKVNYLAEKFGYEIFIVLTETQQAEPYFPLHPSIHLIYLNLDFRKLDALGIVKKMLKYVCKIREYRRKLERLLVELNPDITTSLLAWEIDFIGKLRDGSPKIGECHFNKDFRYLFIATNSRASFLRKYIARIRSRQLVRNARRLDKLVLLTRQDADAWREISRKAVIPNALFSYPACQSNCLNKSIVAAGRYTFQKGYDLLLKAWRMLEPVYPDWRLSIYGEGNCRRELEDYVSRYGLKRVSLEYPVQNIFEKFTEAGFLVLPSRFEGFGMVIIEAMACGLPVVAFDCQSGPAEIIRNGEDGLLVSAENVDELADKMAELMTDNGKRIRMGATAKVNSIRFNIDSVMSQWKDLYCKVVR